jgi:hypothetical protein
MSARSPAIETVPLPSTRKPNFDGKSCKAASDASRRTSVRATGRTSNDSNGSRPASGPTMTLRPASVRGSRSRRSSSSNAPRRPCRLSSLTPLICILPRRVRSIWPLPNRAAAAARPLASSSRKAPHHGRTRAISPSPLCMGCRTPGHQPFTSIATATLMGRPRSHERVPHRPHCVGSPKAPAPAHPADAPQSQEPPPDSSLSSPPEPPRPQ